MLDTMFEWYQRYLAYWHGCGEPHQYLFYRCDGCHRLVSWKVIRQGGCRCETNKLRPARLSWGEMVRCLCLPWSVR